MGTSELGSFPLIGSFPQEGGCLQETTFKDEKHTRDYRVPKKGSSVATRDIVSRMDQATGTCLMGYGRPLSERCHEATFKMCFNLVHFSKAFLLDSAENINQK